ncbi:MAG: DEAD/DEAH box helicase [Planctomycetota bacterium]|jgi:superfamily II DNA or RNA helicase
MIWVLAAAGAAITISGGSYLLSGIFHAARRARRLRREIRQEIGKTKKVLTSRESALRETCRGYVDAQVRERLTEVSLDVLRDQTDRKVKIAPLEAAGFSTVAELVGKSRKELRAVRGIGPHSARAVERAVRDYLSTAQRLTPALPDPGLTEPRAVDLGRDSLVYLEAWRDLGDSPTGMREHFDPLETELRGALKRAGFLPWLGRVVRRRSDTDLTERLQRLSDLAEEVRDSPAFADAAAARSRLERSTLPGLPAETVREEFRRNYADLSALLERIFGELDLEAGLRRGPAIAPAPEQAEIARKVEGFPLDASGLRLILRGYQVFGAKFLLALERTVLGDEMGLGKTIQALAAQVHLENANQGCRSLVVAPASILGNWIHEIGLRTDLRSHLLHGDDFDRALDAWSQQGGMAVTSYATLRNNLDDFTQRGPRGIALLIADEAHYIKNPKAGRTQALCRIANRAERVCFMTGTPLENHPEEFVQLLDSLAPDRARDLDAFLDRPGSVLGGAKHFHAELADVYLRRNQEDVLKELPPRIDKEEWIDLSPEARERYTSEVEAGNFMGMRQAVTGPAKLERLEDLLEEYKESGIKVLLFSYFLNTLAQVEGGFPVLGRITGEVEPEERFALAQRFQEADGHQLLIAQIQAGGTGLNLHAAGAVVLMEPQLKPTTEAQAVARAHRMGQTRRVVVHRMLARDSVDERIVELLEEKRDLFERFARESLIKEASKEATAASPVVKIIEAERARMTAR